MKINLVNATQKRIHFTVIIILSQPIIPPSNFEQVIAT
jgi:hypothetical protein